MAETYFCLSCMEQLETKNDICPHCGGMTEPQNKAHQLPLGSILKGRYLMGKALGEGGFGITYVGYDLLLQSKVAIKEYFPSTAANRSAEQVYPVQTGEDSSFQRGKKHFMREADILISLQEVPNIVRIKDYFEENGTAYIIMEYLDGRDLRSFFLNNGTIGFNKAVEMLRPLMKALGQVHEKGIIHRDISPSNIMLLNNGEIRLLDFGAAIKADEEGTEFDSLLIKHGYAPPEQYRNNESQGPWTDVYALCATLYMLICGKEPESAVDRAHMDKLIPPRKLGVSISAAEEAALLRGMELDSKKRISGMASLELQLDGGEKPGIGFIKLLVPLCAAAAVFVAVFLFAGKSQEQPVVQSEASVSVSSSTALPRPSIVLPEIVLDEPLLPEACPVPICADMNLMEGFEEQTLIDDGDFTVIAEECWVGDNCLSLVCRYELPDNRTIENFFGSFYYDNSAAISLNIINENGGRAYRLNSADGYICMNICTAFLPCVDIMQLSSLNLHFYWAYSKLGNEGLYNSRDIEVVLPDTLKFDAIGTPVSVKFDELSFDCYGAVLYSDGTGDLIYEITKGRKDTYLELSGVSVDGNEVELNSRWNTLFDVFEWGDNYNISMFQYNRASYHDAYNVMHIKGDAPQTLTITVDIIRTDDWNDNDELTLGTIALNFTVDEKGVCTLTDFVSDVYPTQ